MISKAFKIKSLAVALVLTALFGVQAFAQNTTRTLVVTRDAKVGGVVLAQGKYTIAFDDKKDGEAVITKSGREVAKVAYKLVDLTKDASENAVVFTRDADGSFQVRRIEMKGSKMALQFD